VNKLLQLLKKNLNVLLNAGSIVGTTAVTSLLGFAYWAVATRLSSDDVSGLADTMISMMLLLGTMSMMGLGTLLTGELTRQPGKEWALINAAMIFVGGVGVVTGIFFAFLAPYISPNLALVGNGPVSIAIFSLGVGFTALTMVLDQALIGILRGGVQLARNTVFSFVKLAVLVACAYFFSTSSLLIYTAWLIGNVISLLVLVGQTSKKAAPKELDATSTVISRALNISGSLSFTGPLTTIEKKILLPCPDCGTPSPNSASFCINCGYPFSPTVEISSVRPQLLFSYGVIGLSESSLRKKNKNVVGNRCPTCGNAVADNNKYCASCGYALTPTIEIPSIKLPPSRFDIEATDTMPLALIKKANTRQTLSAESTQLFLNPTQSGQKPASAQRAQQDLSPDETLLLSNFQKPTAFSRSLLPVEDAETLDMSNLPKPAAFSRSSLPVEDAETLDMSNLPKPAAFNRSSLPVEDAETLDMSNLPRTPRTGTHEQSLSRMDAKRSALFSDDQNSMNLSHLPRTPFPNMAGNTRPAKEKSKRSKKGSIMPEWGLLRKLGRAAIQHHTVNLILMAPSQLLPIMVAVLLDNAQAGYFYVSFMLANFIFSLTYSLTQVLHAISSAQPSILAQKIRFTFGLSCLAGLSANLVLQVGAGFLLAAFKPEYAGAAGCLRVLALAVFPIIVKSHYLAICRVYDRTKQIIIPIMIGSLLELGLAVTGAEWNGLLGLSLGWFAALLLEAVYMTPTVYRAANPVNINIVAGKKQARA